ncbi:hypothetical protein SAMN04488029_1683 [Reichenbachiella faecimaris]|uniref:Uncharacterized protein n=1 Tax=Reichenbachiella faecimaris TaxID=692418 RepID=A0A1W2GB31_REIFA|nr:hypothetical protein [Reichenbachiella faecimaris]SMD33811.1 hypothetical protein SAMN04488029_1683 [Reichenbachiella faecimaris]
MNLSVKQLKFRSEQIFRLNHEIRKYLTNAVSLCELLEGNEISDVDFDRFKCLLLKSLQDLDSALYMLDDSEQCE